MTDIPPPPTLPNYGPAGGASYPKNWMGITALILGIVSILNLCCCYLLSPLIAVGAIVLGVLGNKAVATGEANNGGLAKAGLITGIVGGVLSVLVVILYLVLFGFSLTPAFYEGF